MAKPILVVMAAGLGSRYGGLKQLQPVGAHGQALMDYALYDAKRAGFEEAVFVISPAMEAQGFSGEIQARLGDALRVRCAVQDLKDVPAGYAVPKDRVKPWGTGHAVRACRDIIDAPFAAVNADDFYGRSSYQAIYDFLTREEPLPERRYAMVGYAIGNTLSESGYVARGECAVNEAGQLISIYERTHIISTTDGPLYTEDGLVYHRMPDDAVVSMNIWAFPPAFMQEADRRFSAFLDRTLAENPLKGEFFLPELVGETLRDGAVAEVLPCDERWYGVTYKQDLPLVLQAIERMTREGEYPERLWQ